MRRKDQSRLSKDLPEIRKRLSSLSRDSGKPQPQEPQAPEEQAQPSVPGPAATNQKPAEPASSGALGRLRRRVLSSPSGAGPAALSPAQPPVRLEDALPGIAEPTADGRRAYHIHRTVRDACPEVAATETDFAQLVQQTRLERFLHSRTPEALSPEEIVFLDLETTGLDITPLFLIGIMVWEGDGLVVRQFFARDYDEEPAVLSLFLERYENHPVLITFNGRSYDLPYVRMRARATKVPFRYSPAHIDLLIEARKVWRGVLPDCRLQTLERLVLGRDRQDDIPGSAIPQAYHDFVQTGDARQMVSVLEHNLLDLVTMAQLLVHLSRRRD
jgi:uncharacterized protein YprB with RNaseH-like and TPR domain